jgi:hypothetical protein
VPQIALMLRPEQRTLVGATAPLEFAESLTDSGARAESDDQVRLTCAFARPETASLKSSNGGNSQGSVGFFSQLTWMWFL